MYMEVENQEVLKALRSKSTVVDHAVFQNLSLKNQIKPEHNQGGMRLYLGGDIMKKTSIYLKVTGILGGLILSQASMAIPMNFSFSGNFVADDDVQFINFSGSGGSGFLVSYGYGGGIQADGSVVPAGGFDIVTSLFDSNGQLIVSVDEGDVNCFAGAEIFAPGIDAGNSDPVTGSLWDTCLTGTLPAGAYTIAISQYDNSPAGLNLSDGFTREGQGNFTGSDCTNGQFCDINGDNRTPAWAFDVLGADSANAVSVPATLVLFGVGLAGLGWSRGNKAQTEVLT